MRTNVIKIKAGAPSVRPQFLTAPEAAQLAGVTPATMSNWCSRYVGLGKMVGGRWRIDPVILARILAGERMPRLTWVRQPKAS